MKPRIKILLAFAFVNAALLITGFYYSAPDRHNALIFLDKMNVFYIGVDNPVDITACGLAPASLHVSISGGSLTMDRPGKYNVIVTGGTEATINVMQSDSGPRLGSFKFRVKRIPDPVAYFGNIKGDGLMSKAEMLNNDRLFARMENFDFDVLFHVISFSMITNEKGKWQEYKSKDNLLTDEMKNVLKNSSAGDMIFFQKVVVKGPDGTIRKIPGIDILVK
jgi:hypothetical protein